MVEEILNKLTSIEKLLNEQNMLQKDVLDIEEASKYLKVTQDKMYRFTSTNTLPIYKPNGRKIFFKRSELDEWLVRNKIHSKDELESKTDDFFNSKGNRKF